MNRTERIKLVRREVLVSLKTIYPAAMEAEQLYRALLAVFCDLEFDNLRQDLAYLLAKGYLERKLPRKHDNPDMVPWKHRWFKLTAEGVEIADRARVDEALEV